MSTESEAAEAAIDEAHGFGETGFSPGLTRAWDYKRPEAEWSEWQPITESDYWYCLEVLPPRYIVGGFAVSEAVTDNARGEVVYLCIRGGAKNARARLASIREVNEEPTK